MILNIHEPIYQVVVSFFFSLLLAASLIIYKFVFKKKLNLLLTLILISILPVISIFRSGTYEAGDLTLHSVLLQSFFENLKDGILLPQWAGGLCRSYGCPVFISQYLTPYYISSFFHIFGFSFLDSMKLFLASSFILSGITMYIFIKDQHGEISAFIGSLLYVFAPIHLMETHFRASVGTCAAFIFIPLLFLFAKKSTSGKLHFMILTSISVSLLLLSHSSISLVIIPSVLLYIFILRKRILDLIYPFVSILLGFGLTALYVLPALFEVRYTWYFPQFAKSIGDFFPFFYYIYSPARFGLLFQGNNGELRLIIGYAQLAIVVISIYYLLTNKYDKTNKRIVVFLLFIFLLCFTLMQSFTKIIWNNIFLLKSFILPWRMLVPIAFATAYIGAITTKNWNKKALLIFSILIIGSTILNWGNRKMVPLNPQAYYDPGFWYSEYYEPNNPDYLKIYEKKSKLIFSNPTYKLKNAQKPIDVLEGKVEIIETGRTQINHEYLVYAITEAKFSENTFYFPGWKVYANGKEIPINIKNEKSFGTLTFSLKKGHYKIRATFEDTEIRTIAKYISTLTLLFLLLLVLRNSKRFRP